MNNNTANERNSILNFLLCISSPDSNAAIIHVIGDIMKNFRNCASSKNIPH